MNDFEKYFYSNKGKAIHKFAHYFEIYERYFSRMRGEAINVVEIGIGDGGSLQMWQKYFGSKAKIFGVDISTHAFQDDDDITYICGDQNDDFFLTSLPKLTGPIDILIDDGSHINSHQIKTFELLFPHIRQGGIYLCEDVQTSYQDQFGGGYLRPGSYVAAMKHKIDEMNAWAAEPGTGQLKTYFTRQTYAIHFYPYMVVVEKRLMDEVLRSPVVSGGLHVQPRRD